MHGSMGSFLSEALLLTGRPNRPIWSFCMRVGHLVTGKPYDDSWSLSRAVGKLCCCTAAILPWSFIFSHCTGSSKIARMTTIVATSAGVSTRCVS
jgi:hypothetical protein